MVLRSSSAEIRPSPSLSNKSKTARTSAKSWGTVKGANTPSCPVVSGEVTARGVDGDVTDRPSVGFRGEGKVFALAGVSGSVPGVAGSPGPDIGSELHGFEQDMTRVKPGKCRV